MSLDTVMFQQFPTRIDSAQLRRVDLKPPGLHYECGNAMQQCTYFFYPWDSTGQFCLDFDGTLTIGAFGFMHMYAIVRKWVTIPFVGPYSWDDSLDLKIEVQSLVGVEREAAQLANLEVYPSPVAAQGMVRYSVPGGPQQVRLRVVDMLGRERLTLVDAEQEGPQELAWDASSLPAGTYLIQGEWAGTEVVLSERFVVLR